MEKWGLRSTSALDPLFRQDAPNHHPLSLHRPPPLPALNSPTVTRMSAVPARPPPKNDYVPPAPLAGSLRRPLAGTQAGAAAPTVDPEEYLVKAEKEWNERVDREVGGLAAGLEGLVKSFQVVRPALSSLTVDSRVH